jgi:hypothetical protein
MAQKENNNDSHVCNVANLINVFNKVADFKSAKLTLYFTWFMISM